MNKVLILAPHADDEVIGCWSVLNQKDHIDVIYFFEVDLFRRQEAERAAEALGYNAHFDESIGYFEVPPGYDRVYVPSRRDWHADHKLVNSKYRNKATHFYSVDMAHGVYLGSVDSVTKREFLDKHYASQQSLWRHNDKYWLFEDIQTTDYDVYRNLGWTLTNGHLMQVWIPEQYVDWVHHKWWPSVDLSVVGRFQRKDIDSLLSHCKGKITLKDMYGKITEVTS